jgi:hypothetical protein
MNSKRDSETGKSAIDAVFKQMITTLFQGWEIRGGCNGQENNT